MTAFPVRRSVAVAVASVALVAAGTTAAMACVRWPGTWGNPALPSGSAGSGWVPDPCGLRWAQGLLPADVNRPVGAAHARRGCPPLTAWPGGGPGATPTGAVTGTPKRPRARPGGDSSTPARKSSRASTKKTIPATPKRTTPAAKAGPVLWGPFTMTLSNVAPVIDPWQSSAVTATSEGLVVSVKCSSGKRVVARVSLFDADFAKVATAADLTCDGATRTRSFVVTKGATYYVSIYVDGASVPTTASVSARLSAGRASRTRV